jgi:ribonuclease HI
VKVPKPLHQIIEEFIHRSKPWAHFDGASQDEPPMAGVGGIIFFYDSHTISFNVGIRSGSNNLVELLGLKLTLTLVVEYGLTSIQIFGDSLLVIKWFKK